jgi:hypothetical protein
MDEDSSGGGKRVMMPEWFVKHRRAGFAIGINVCITILALACAVHAKKNNKTELGGQHEATGAYVFAMIVSVITLPIEWAVDRRNPEMTKDLRFDLAGALIALAIIRLESTRQIGGYSIQGTKCRGMYFETENTHFQVAIDVFFFIAFLGAKLVGRTGSRELAMLVMADIVDFIELTFAMTSFTGVKGDAADPVLCNVAIKGPTCNAIVAFTFIFALVTLLLQRAEGPGQKALNALVQGIFVHVPLIAIRLAIPISQSNQTSFNLVFILKNVAELVTCVMDFLDAGSEVRNGGGSGGYDNLN